MQVGGFCPLPPSTRYALCGARRDRKSYEGDFLGGARGPSNSEVKKISHVIRARRPGARGGPRLARSGVSARAPPRASRGPRPRASQPRSPSTRSSRQSGQTHRPRRAIARRGTPLPRGSPSRRAPLQAGQGPPPPASPRHLFPARRRDASSAGDSPPRTSTPLRSPFRRAPLQACQSPPPRASRRHHRLTLKCFPGQQPPQASQGPSPCVSPRPRRLNYPTLGKIFFLTCKLGGFARCRRPLSMHCVGSDEIGKATRAIFSAALEGRVIAR